MSIKQKPLEELTHNYELHITRKRKAQEASDVGESATSDIATTITVQNSIAVQLAWASGFTDTSLAALTSLFRLRPEWRSYYYLLLLQTPGFFMGAFHLELQKLLQVDTTDTLKLKSAMPLINHPQVDLRDVRLAAPHVGLSNIALAADNYDDTNALQTELTNAAIASNWLEAIAKATIQPASLLTLGESALVQENGKNADYAKLNDGYVYIFQGDSEQALVLKRELVLQNGAFYEVDLVANASLDERKAGDTAMMELTLETEQYYQMAFSHWPLSAARLKCLANKAQRNLRCGPAFYLPKIATQTTPATATLDSTKQVLWPESSGKPIIFIADPLRLAYEIHQDLMMAMLNLGRQVSTVSQKPYQDTAALTYQLFFNPLVNQGQYPELKQAISNSTIRGVLNVSERRQLRYQIRWLQSLLVNLLGSNQSIALTEVFKDGFSSSMPHYAETFSTFTSLIGPLQIDPGVFDNTLDAAPDEVEGSDGLETSQLLTWPIGARYSFSLGQTSHPLHACLFPVVEGSDIIAKDNDGSGDFRLGDFKAAYADNPRRFSQTLAALTGSLCNSGFVGSQNAKRHLAYWQALQTERDRLKQLSLQLLQATGIATFNDITLASHLTKDQKAKANYQILGQISYGEIPHFGDDSTWHDAAYSEETPMLLEQYLRQPNSAQFSYLHQQQLTYLANTGVATTFRGAFLKETLTQVNDTDLENPFVILSRHQTEVLARLANITHPAQKALETSIIHRIQGAVQASLQYHPAGLLQCALQTANIQEALIALLVNDLSQTKQRSISHIEHNLALQAFTADITLTTVAAANYWSLQAKERDRSTVNLFMDSTFFLNRLITLANLPKAKTLKEAISTLYQLSDLESLQLSDKLETKFANGLLVSNYEDWLSYFGLSAGLASGIYGLFYNRRNPSLTNSLLQAFAITAFTSDIPSARRQAQMAYMRHRYQGSETKEPKPNGGLPWEVVPNWLIERGIIDSIAIQCRLDLGDPGLLQAMLTSLQKDQKRYQQFQAAILYGPFGQPTDSELSNWLTHYLPPHLSWYQNKQQLQLVQKHQDVSTKGQDFWQTDYLHNTRRLGYEWSRENVGEIACYQHLYSTLANPAISYEQDVKSQKIRVVVDLTHTPFFIQKSVISLRAAWREVDSKTLASMQGPDISNKDFYQEIIENQGNGLKSLNHQIAKPCRLIEAYNTSPPHALCTVIFEFDPSEYTQEASGSTLHLLTSIQIQDSDGTPIFPLPATDALLTDIQRITQTPKETLQKNQYPSTLKSFFPDQSTLLARLHIGKPFQANNPIQRPTPLAHPLPDISKTYKTLMQILEIERPIALILLKDAANAGYEAIQKPLAANTTYDKFKKYLQTHQLQIVETPWFEYELEKRLPSKLTATFPTALGLMRVSITLKLTGSIRLRKSKLEFTDNEEDLTVNLKHLKADAAISLNKFIQDNVNVWMDWEHRKVSVGQSLIVEGNVLHFHLTGTFQHGTFSVSCSQSNLKANLSSDGWELAGDLGYSIDGTYDLIPGSPKQPSFWQKTAQEMKQNLAFEKPIAIATLAIIVTVVSRGRIRVGGQYVKQAAQETFGTLKSAAAWATSTSLVSGGSVAYADNKDNPQ